MYFRRNWYIGFVGFIGLYKFTDAMAAFSGNGTWLDACALGWLVFLLFFIPENRRGK